MIRAILFDLDGTLANSLEDLANAANYAIGTFGFDAHPVSAYRFFAGNGIPKMIERALPESHRDAETVEKCRAVFMARYEAHYADCTCGYDGVAALLDELKQRNIRLAVVTNKAQEMAQKVVTKLYGDRFDLIVGKREEFPSKPDPAAALFAMRELGVSPETCLFVGDSGIDIKTGVNSGAVPIGVTWGFRPVDELKENGARFIIDRPRELLPLLEDFL